MLNRRRFLSLTGVLASLPIVRLSAQRARGGAALEGPLPPSGAAVSRKRGS